MSRIAKAIFLVLCLCSATFFKNSSPTVKANLTLKVPYDYPTIQEAINNASPGDTILVSNGVYRENIIINKSLTLIGEDRKNTIINGRNIGNVISVKASNVSISGFTIKNSYPSTGSGISIEYFGNIVIKYNDIIENGVGILLASSYGNKIYENEISANYIGIQLFYSYGNTIYSNAILNNTDGIDIYYYSIGNVIYENTFYGNGWCINIFLRSNNNIFYRNNFIANSYDVDSETTNIWSHAGEGNYWDKYRGLDLNRDGIGDFPHNVTVREKDYYPLMGKFYNFPVPFNQVIYHVTIISNSTILNFDFKNVAETKSKLIIFNASCAVGFAGFSRVMIPKTLMPRIHIVLINEEEINVTLLNVADDENFSLHIEFSDSCSVKIAYSELFDLCNQLLADYSNILDKYYSLNDSLRIVLEDYGKLKEEFHNMSSSYQRHEQNFKSLLYVVATATSVFIMATIYLSKKAHEKQGQSMKSACTFKNTVNSDFLNR